jgi:lauroyl/myristoyl acyltransferase
VSIIRGRDLYLLAVLAMMVIVAPLPFEMPRRLVGTGVAAIAYRLSGRKRRRSEQGVERTFPDAMTPRQRTAIVKGAFRQFWQDPFISPRSVRTIDNAVVGLSHVYEALAAGRGVILWESSQFGGRVAAKRILRDAGLSICQVHVHDHAGGFGTGGRRASFVQKRLIESHFDRHELRFVAEIVRLPLHEKVAGRRSLVRLLAENRIVCMANDGMYGQRFVSVPFLGHSRSVATGTVTLARATGATMLPMFCVEAPVGKWRVIIEPPIRSDAANRDQAAYDIAAQYVALLESYIRRYPDQYRTWDALRPRSAPEESAGETRA